MCHHTLQRAAPPLKRVPGHVGEHTRSAHAGPGARRARTMSKASPLPYASMLGCATAATSCVVRWWYASSSSSSSHPFPNTTLPRQYAPLLKRRPPPARKQQEPPPDRARLRQGRSGGNA